ncbi:O-fucosyltransferase 9 [Olea europaea subsp. europaea]|uniref:O-fucosyltransferase family protein n=1 Tax=Olea europaea subsp. europaea TaxID=158383 RepID=A0A8S0V8K4_OLEEU|nr:O-fucosyltransferase 9 [Olea europaea subsp. europaea]
MLGIQSCLKVGSLVSSRLFLKQVCFIFALGINLLVGFFCKNQKSRFLDAKTFICDAVAVAGLLNATLVIPIFHLNSVWRDSSKFADIFDEEFFIYALRNQVDVVRELPEHILQQFDNNISNIVNLRVKAWSSPTYYIQKVLPKLRELGAVRIAPFSNRLAYAVPSNIQGLRCLCNFEALRFSEPIRMLAAKMVDRMVKASSKSGARYISVHLRFEERERERESPVLCVINMHYVIKCHLVMQGHSSRLAALDYTVCLHSEVFVTTQGGNFPHFLVGHRRYFYEGHAKTIKPDKRKLVQLFDNPSIRWQDFKRQLLDMLRHSDVKGVELRKPSSSLYMYPTPDCMCRKADL